MVNMKHILLYESYPTVVSDPMFNGDIFRIKLKPLDDLSNRRGSDLPPKPINDLLDKFQSGDIVTGKAIIDGDYVTGKVIKIEKDEKGENTQIFIEHDGEIIELATATVEFDDGGDIGNQNTNTYVPADKVAIDNMNYDPVTSTYENMRHIKKM